MKNREKKTNTRQRLCLVPENSSLYVVSVYYKRAKNLGRDSTKDDDDDDDAKEESRARELDRAKEIYDCVCTRSV